MRFLNLTLVALVATTFSSAQTRVTLPASDAGTQFGTRFAGGMQPVRTVINQSRTCRAVAPANWIIFGERREGDALDMATPDGRAYGGYGISGVPGGLAMAYPNFATPENKLHNELTQGGRQVASYGQPIRDEMYGYTWMPFELSTPGDAGEPAKGVLLYRAWPVPGDPLGYVVIVRRAQTVKSLWGSQGAQAIAVALSIRCTAQLRPSRDGGGGGAAEDDRIESTYNRQLGMEYAHDGRTGENYWVSPGSDWRNDGPEGPGYYTRSGNELRRLLPGRSD